MSSDGNNDCRDLSWSLYMVSLDEKPCIHRVMKVRPTVTLLVTFSLNISAYTCNKSGLPSINMLYVFNFVAGENVMLCLIIMFNLNIADLNSPSQFPALRT